jgi:hypothetical protein
MRFEIKVKIVDVVEIGFSSDRDEMSPLERYAISLVAGTLGFAALMYFLREVWWRRER